MINRLLWSICLLLVATQGLAESLPADNCEVFIKKIGAAPNSHASGAVYTVVKVGWIGNDEHIQRVSFHGYTKAEDLGNVSQCGAPRYNDPTWRDIAPEPSNSVLFLALK